MKVDLSDQVALVTGAARGIGQAIADALAANGARVVYTDIDLPGAKEAAARTAGSRRSPSTSAIAGQIDAVLAEVVRDLGRLDILVNNAGVNTLAHRVPIDQFPVEEWDRIVKVDLDGVFLISRAALANHGEAAAPAASSTSPRSPAWCRCGLQCAFVAAKAGVVNLTKAMALELGPRGVLVNCIAPGSILTDGTRKLFYDPDGSFRANVQQMLAHVPLGRPGTPEEIAHAALFLAAPESSYVNGSILTVDGGWTAGYTREF